MREISKRWRPWMAAAAVLAALAAGGCQSTMASYSASSRNKQLQTASEDYNKLIRWQEWERASEFIRPEDQGAFKEKMQEVEETFRITEFEVQDTSIDGESKSATVRVRYHYYKLPSVTEKKMTVRQRWIWSEEGRRWLLDAPLAFLSLAHPAGPAGPSRHAHAE